MGGIIIFIAIAVPFLILTDYDWRVAGGLRRGDRLRAARLRRRLHEDRQAPLARPARAHEAVVTIAISLGLWWVAHPARRDLRDTLRLRVVDYQIDLGVFYPRARSTSWWPARRARVNLTDGLDGLAAGCAAIVLLAYIGITFITTGQRDLALLAGCLVGACVGFLWFNAFPADDLHGRHRLARARRRDRRAGGDDQDRDPADHARRRSS